MYEFLERIHFFLPSNQLTWEIVDHNHELTRWRNGGEPPDSLEEILPRYESGEADAVRAESFLSALSARGLLFRREYSQGEKFEIYHQNRLIIAERLYGYLAILARPPYASDGVRYDLWKVIPEGMGLLLGFNTPFPVRRESEGPRHIEVEGATEGRSRELLGMLTGEFQSWLWHDRGGHYEAPWGEVILEGNALLLIAKTFPPPEPNKSFTPAKYGPPLTEEMEGRDRRRR